MTNIELIRRKIEEFHVLFSHTKDDYEDFDEEISHIPIMEAGEYFDFLKKRESTPFGRLCYIDFHDFIVNEVFKAYVEANEEERQMIIDQFNKCFHAKSEVWGLMRDYRWRLHHSEQDRCPAILRRLLLFAILDETSLDQYETGNILRGAWYEAVHNGLDPVLFFKEAAAMAGRRKVIYGRSASEMLKSFNPAG